MLLRCVALAGAVVMVTTACTGGSGAERPAGSSSSKQPNLGEVIDEAPTLRPLVSDRTPLWNQDTKGVLKFVSGAALRGDAVVLVGGAEKDRDDRMVVADARTGKVRWSVTAYGPLRDGDGADWGGMPYGLQTPQIVGEGDDWGVLTQYFLTACRHPTGFCPLGSGPSDETGVVLLSGKGGRVRWKLPLIPARTGGAARAASRLTGALVTTDGRIALATVHTVGSTRFDDIRLIGMDVTTGRRLWTRSGIQPATIAGSTVLGSVPTHEGQSILDVTSGSVIALDAATGRTRWELSARLPASLTMLTAGGLALVRGTRGDAGLGSGPYLLLDARTGRELVRLPDGISDCQTDGVSLIACGVVDGGRRRLVTIRLDDRRLRVSKRTIPGVMLEAVWQGHVFLSDLQSRGHEVDRAANSLAAGLPGHPIAFSDRYAIFREGSWDEPRYSVYRVG